MGLHSSINILHQLAFIIDLWIKQQEFPISFVALDMGSSVQDMTVECIKSCEAKAKPWIKFLKDEIRKTHESKFDYYLKYLFVCCIKPREIMIMLGFRVTKGSAQGT